MNESELCRAENANEADACGNDSPLNDEEYKSKRAADNRKKGGRKGCAYKKING